MVRSARRPLRREVCGWQRAAAGLLALSVVWNALLYAAFGQARRQWRQETAQLRSRLHTAQQMRDQAVGELGTLALNAAREKQERAAQAEAYEAAGDWTYIGECRLTAYCPCEECCGRWADGLTAAGLPAGPGIVAVDPEVIPLGSTVVIDGQKYLAADTGVTGNHVDICVADHQAAEDFGVQAGRVWVVR